VDDRDDRAYARPPRPEDVALISRALNEAGARYLLIGGFAVNAHGLLRPTKDIDFLIDDSPENVERAKKALAVLPDNAAAEMADTDVREYGVVRVADEVVVDLLGRACGVSYDEAIADAQTMNIEGVEVPVASLRTLIRTKQTIRPSDSADRQFLEDKLANEGRKD